MDLSETDQAAHAAHGKAWNMMTEREVARRAKAAVELGELATVAAQALARVPPALTVREALARRAQVMRAAARAAGRPWIAEG